MNKKQMLIMWITIIIVGPFFGLLSSWWIVAIGVIFTVQRKNLKKYTFVVWMYLLAALFVFNISIKIFRYNTSMMIKEFMENSPSYINSMAMNKFENSSKEELIEMLIEAFDEISDEEIAKEAEINVAELDRKATRIAFIEIFENMSKKEIIEMMLEK